MGLDVTAFEDIQKIDCIFNAEGEAVDPKTRRAIDYDTYFHPRHNNDFPGRADDIEDNACYTYADAIDVSAGPYSKYNWWRDELAKLAGYPLGKYEKYGTMYDSYCVACWNGKTGPFSELINFSDCEGTIGTAVSKKLAADFAKFQTAGDAHPDEYFWSKYSEWRTAFEMAANNGCVIFH